MNGRNPYTDKISQQLHKWLLRAPPVTAVRRMHGISAALGSDIGTERNQNQDRVIVARDIDFHGEPFTILALSDGMGGMQGGEDCAATTLAAFTASLSSRSKSVGMTNDWLVSAAIDANNAVYEKYNGSGGATLSAVVVKKDNKINWINVGDSRIYSLNRGTLNQITTDDTLAGQLGHNEGPASRRTELLQFIGMGPGLEPHVTRGSLEQGDSILLTSDGIHYLDHAILEKIIIKAKDPGTCIRRLIEVAKWCGGHDNCSGIFFTPSPNDSDSRPLSDLDISNPHGEMQLNAMFISLEIEQPAIQPPLLSQQKQKKNRTRKSSTKKTAPKAQEDLAEIKATQSAEENQSQAPEDKPEEKKPPQLKMIFPLKDV